MMRKDKGIDPQRLMQLDTLSAILLFAHDIMVPEYKFERSIVEMLHKFAEHLPLRVVMTMEQVAQANKPCGMCRLNQINDHFKVSIVRLRRHGYARTAKVIDLPQMKISKKKDALTSPKHRFLWVKLQGFTEYIRRQHGGNLLNQHQSQHAKQLIENQLVINEKASNLKKS